jgi:hypothetical protein
MSPEQRLHKAFELSDFSKALFAQELRRRFLSLSEEEFQEITGATALPSVTTETTDRGRHGARKHRGSTT